MRLFLSYGHDEHTAFALRLKADLERRGHEVWFDAERLEPGADWERYIEEGLDVVAAGGGKFLLLLTPHSVRRPGGYCLNELARACSRGLAVIPLMVSTVEPPLSLAAMQWLDFRDCLPPEEHDVKYAARFARLREAIEHNRLNFEGAQARLRAVLQPIEYDEAARHLPRFTGRAWVDREVTRWLARGGRRVLWITGEAGIGKSALAAWLCARRPEIAGAHYCRYGNAGRSDRKALLSLAWQLSTQLPDYEARLNASALEGIAGESTLAALFDRLFVTPLRDLPPPERAVALLIDGLDEAAEATAQGANPLAWLIGTEWGRTPEWLRLMVTSRPHEAEINAGLQALDPWVIEAGGAENREDLRTYLRRELRPFAAHGAPDEAVVEAILQKSEGLFLYAWWVREELAAGRLKLDGVEAFPRGLGGIYGAFFQRYFPDRERYAERWRPVIETICAARQPLPRDVLGALFPAFYDASEITSGLGSLFPDAGGGVRPFHQSVRDWVTKPERAGPYLVRTDAGEARLADEGWRQYRSVAGMKPYFVVHLPAHLAACGRKGDLARLLVDPEWMVAKLKAAGVNALIADYEYVKASEEAGLIQGALRLSSNVLAVDAEQFAGQMVGRLLPHQGLVAIRRFTDEVAAAAPVCWLRPRRPALVPPGTGLVRTLEGHSSWVSDVAVTADGELAVSASDDNTLKVWDLETGRTLRTLEGHSARVLGVAVTPGGRRAVSASADKTLKVWDLETGGVLRTLEGHSAEVSGVAVARDGKWAVSASDDSTLKVWDLETGRTLRTLKGHFSGVSTVAATADGTRAVCGFRGYWLEVWDLETGRALRILGSHSDSVTCVAVTPDGKWAVSGSNDNTLEVWDLGAGGAHLTLRGHSDGVLGVAVTPDGKRAVSVSWDNTLRVWDLETGGVLRTLKSGSLSDRAVAVTPDGKRAVSASNDKTLKVWDLETGGTQHTLEGHSAVVYCVAVTPNGKQALSASMDHTLKVWDPETGRALRSLEGHSAAVYSVGVAPDGKLAVSGCRDGTLKVWDLESGAALRTLEGHSAAVAGVAVMLDGKRAVSASYDKTLKVWDLETGRTLRTLEGHSAGVERVVVMADGKLAVSGSNDQTLKVWDLETGLVLCTLKGHSDSVNGVAVTADGKRVVSASWDHTLKVWDLETGRALRTLEGHSARVNGVAVTGDGKRAVSASWDKTLKVWELETGLVLATFHCDAVPPCCAFAGGQTIVAGDDVGQLHFLRFEERAP